MKKAKKAKTIIFSIMAETFLIFTFIVSPLNQRILENYGLNVFIYQLSNGFKSPSSLLKPINLYIENYDLYRTNFLYRSNFLSGDKEKINNALKQTENTLLEKAKYTETYNEDVLYASAINDKYKVSFSIDFKNNLCVFSMLENKDYINTDYRYIYTISESDCLAIANCIKEVNR